MLVPESPISCSPTRSIVFLDGATPQRFNVGSVATTAGLPARFQPVAHLRAGLDAVPVLFRTCSGPPAAAFKIFARADGSQALAELMSIIHPRAYLPVKLSAKEWKTHHLRSPGIHVDLGGSVVAMAMCRAWIIVTALRVIVSICNTGRG